MKLAWRRNPRSALTLYAICDYGENRLTPTGLRDTDLDPVQDWCVANQCGVRMSFDTFRFVNEKELAIFLLKWS